MIKVLSEVDERGRYKALVSGHQLSILPVAEEEMARILGEPYADVEGAPSVWAKVNGVLEFWPRPSRGVEILAVSK